MKRILIIDDEQHVADAVILAINDAIPGVDCKTHLRFDTAAEKIMEIRPDAIVLDLMEGHKSDNLPGQITWGSVWNSYFCPIVIYTGSDADLTPSVPEDHPFVKRIQKGMGSDKAVVDSILKFSPAIESIKLLRGEVDAVIHEVLRDTAGSGHFPIDSNSYLLHAGRRRIAASMDNPTITDDRPLASWEMYLVPPLGNHCLTGDILLKRGEPSTTAESFRIVLSPSCDLARGGKVPRVLTAKCYAPMSMMTKFLASLELSNEKPLDVNSLAKAQKKLAKTLQSLVLSQGYWNGWLPLPAFADTLPAMAANLKDLETIPFALLAPTDVANRTYDRVASVDSPFREQVAWAYLNTAARPGMPDRDLATWSEALVQLTVMKAADGTT